MGWKSVDLVSKDLEELGVPLGRSAIRGYVAKGLISPPKPGGGRGRRSLYHPDAAIEAAASRYLIETHSMPFGIVARARTVALHLERAGTRPELRSLKDDRELARLIRGDVLVALMAGEWLRKKLDAEERLLGTERSMERQAEREDGRYREARARGAKDEADDAFGIKTRLKQEIARRWHLRNVAPDLVRIAMRGPGREGL